VVVVGRSLAAVVDVGGGRSVVVESRENAIPNLILFSFSFSTHSHFPSLSLVLVAVVPRGGGRRSFFGNGGRRWYRPFGGGRADASFARAAPVPSHSHSVLRRLRWTFGGAFNNLRWTLVPTPWWSFSNLDNDGGSVATVVDIGAHSVVFDVGLRRACSPWLIATIAFLLDYKWVSNVFFLHYFFINCIMVFITARPGLNSMPLAMTLYYIFFTSLYYIFLTNNVVNLAGQRWRGS